MPNDKVLSCDCGYELRAATEEGQVAELRRHAREAHGVWFSTGEALAVLLRVELEHGVPAELSAIEDVTLRKETR